jgi:hypothetical protein
LRKGTISPIAAFRRYAEFLASTVDEDEAQRAVGTAIAHSPVRTLRWRHRLVTLATALSLFAGANAGLAIAAQGSLPGDELYFFKRAYERVGPFIGFDVDTRLERLEEAVVLAHRGDVPRSLSLTEEALAEFEGIDAYREALEALRVAHEEALLLQTTLGMVMTVDFRRDTQSLVSIADSMVRDGSPGENPVQYAEFLFVTATSVAEQARQLREKAAAATPAAEPEVGD